MELKEKIELIQSSSSKEILNGGVHNGTPLLKYVFQIHEEVFGTACKSCADKLPAYIRKIQNLNTEIMSTKERKYRMKSGSVIHQRGTSHYYSDMNITDEKAEELLKVNPNRAALFAKIPEGALERLAKEKAAEEKAAQEETTEAIQATEETATETPVKTEEAKAEATPEVSEATPAKEEKAEEEKADADLNMTELREKYPHIKARSKEEFLRELNA